MALVSVDGVFEDDPGERDIKGIRIGAGWWDEGTDTFGVRNLFSLTYAAGEGQRLVRTEGNVGIVMLELGPFRAAPTLGAGLEYRGLDPEAGFAGLLSIGLETAVWLPKKWQVALSVQRNFGFPSGTRNEIAFAVRYSPKRVLWWP